ncbi:MAG TPA: nicotinamide-nucleotide amidase [Dongiaceae bacterium]|nr:nicotinamide-nucleotide amidase [Dongiaceae bacterium]
MLTHSDQTLLIEALATQLGSLLRGRGLYVVTAESCTGGWVAESITQVAGSSGWFDRAFVTYSNDAKREMLGVRPKTLEQHGAVSKAVVEEMAKGALKRSRGTFAVAISGIAGPDGGSEEKPVGTVWLAWSIQGRVDSCQVCLPGERRDVRSAAVSLALQGLLVRIRDWMDLQPPEDFVVTEANDT